MAFGVSLGFGVLGFGLLASAQTEPAVTGLAREARLYRQQGYEAQQAGEMEDAIAKYHKAIFLDPAYATAYNDLGVSYEALGQLERARQAYTQCLEVNPRHPSAYANLAMLSERQGKFDEALVYWQRRAELGDPGDLWTQKAQERVAELTGKRPTEVVTSLHPEQTPSANPSKPARPSAAPRPRASVPTTLTSPLSKSYPELEIEVGRLTNELAKVYYELGVAYTELRAYPRAIDAYEKSVALNPAYPQAHAHLGLLYKQVRNDPDKASRHLKTYLRLNPQAADREELEALLALMQRDQPTRSSTGSSAATWGIP